MGIVAGLREWCKRLRAGRSTPFSPRQWDRMRLEESVSGSVAATSVHLLDDPLSSVSWVAMACYVEGIEPRTLGLPEDEADEIEAELRHIEALKPLEAYARCLERLSESDTPDEEESRAED